MQAGNPLARRTDNGRDGDGYPSMGSVAAKFRGANNPEMPAFVGLANDWGSDVWEAGEMGHRLLLAGLETGSRPPNLSRGSSPNSTFASGGGGP